MTEPEWTPCELANAIQKLKLDKAVDEYGLAAEMLKHLPDVYLQKLLDLYNHVFCNGEVPSSWRRTMFTMLGKHAKAKLVSDFRPIASARVLYKTFAYMILGRIEQCLEDSQPDFFFFFPPAPFWTAEVSGLDCFTGQSPGMWTKRVGHFYPGGPGIAREMAKSKPELLNEGLGGGWARGVGLHPRPGFGSRVARSLQHW